MVKRVQEEKTVNLAKQDHRDLQDLTVALEFLAKRENRVHQARLEDLVLLAQEALRVLLVNMVQWGSKEHQELMEHQV